jgi:hypothetical protein
MNCFTKIKRTGKASQDGIANEFLGSGSGATRRKHGCEHRGGSDARKSPALNNGNRVKLENRRLLFGFVIRRCLETPPTHAIGKCVEQSTAFFPTDAGIGDAQSVDQFLTSKQILAAGF